MAERLQSKDFQVDPYRMAILESGWLNAMNRRDSEETRKYLSEGLAYLFHLNRHSADEATHYLLAWFNSGDSREKEGNLLLHHKILSEASGIGFDPDLATKTRLELENGEKGTVAQMSKYLSVLFGGLSEEKLLGPTETRIKAIDNYYAVREKGTKEESIKAFGNLVGELVESYTQLNSVLAG